MPPSPERQPAAGDRALGSSDTVAMDFRKRSRCAVAIWARPASPLESARSRCGSAGRGAWRMLAGIAAAWSDGRVAAELEGGWQRCRGREKADAAGPDRPCSVPRRWRRVARASSVFRAAVRGCVGSGSGRGGIGARWSAARRCGGERLFLGMRTPTFARSPRLGRAPCSNGCDPGARWSASGAACRGWQPRGPFPGNPPSAGHLRNRARDGSPAGGCCRAAASGGGHASPAPVAKRPAQPSRRGSAGVARGRSASEPCKGAASGCRRLDRGSPTRSRSRPSYGSGQGYRPSNRLGASARDRSARRCERPAVPAGEADRSAGGAESGARDRGRERGATAPRPSMATGGEPAASGGSCDRGSKAGPGRQVTDRPTVAGRAGSGRSPAARSDSSAIGRTERPSRAARSRPRHSFSRSAALAPWRPGRFGSLLFRARSDGVVGAASTG